MVIGDDVITRLEYTGIGDMHAIIECFVAAVLEVSGTRL
jgi:hypothetical protein